jgi:hypothetical protein
MLVYRRGGIGIIVYILRCQNELKNRWDSKKVRGKYGLAGQNC